MLSRFSGNHFQRRLKNARNITWYTEKNVLKTKEKLIYPDKGLFSFLCGKFEKHGEKTALVDVITNRSFSYNELITKSKQLASYFHQRGYKESDVIATHLENCIEYPIAIFGTIANDMTLTSTNPTDPENVTFKKLSTSNAKVLITQSKFIKVARNIADKANLDLLITIDEPCVNDSGIVHFYDALGQGEEIFSSSAKETDPKKKILALTFTGGTTGFPKAVMVSQHNMIANIMQFHYMMRANKESPNNVTTIFSPFHIAGLVLTFSHLSYGCTIHCLPQFDPFLFLETIQKYKINMFSGGYFLIHFLLNHPAVKNYDISSVSRVLYGATPLKKNVSDIFCKKYPNITITQGYGSTECLLITKQMENVIDKPKHGSVGNTLIDNSIKIRCLDSGKALGINESGEICIKGPANTFGYKDNPEATRKNFAEDGWIHSGDYGYYNERYELFVVDRVEDLISYKDVKVAPTEIEDVLLTHDDIIDTGVIGIPNEEAGEVPRAYVVRKIGSNLNEDDVIKFVDDNVSSHKRLRGGVQFVNEIPRFGTIGKILRWILIDNYLKASRL